MGMIRFLTWAPSPARIYSIALKELRHIMRDVRFFLLTTIAPAFLLYVLGHVFASDVRRISLAVIDMSRSPVSRQYITALSGSESLAILAHVSAYAEAEEMMDRGEIDAAVVIPPTFSEDLQEERLAYVQMLVDGLDPDTANDAIAELDGLTRAFTNSLRAAGDPTIEARPRAWVNLNLKSQYTMAPGLMPIVLILPALAAAMGLTREKESGTFEMLVTTPVQAFEFMVGKVAAYMLPGLASALLTLAVTVFVFKVPFRQTFQVIVVNHLIFIVIGILPLFGKIFIYSSFILWGFRGQDNNIIFRCQRL